MILAKLLFLSFSEALKIQRNRNGPSEIAIFEALKACFGTKLRITKVAQRKTKLFQRATNFSKGERSCSKENQAFPKENQAWPNKKPHLE